jgi:putative chitinase
MSLQKLQEKIGVTPDGSFGPKTLKAIMVYFKLTPERAAHFCGQLSHETGGFQLFIENLNYLVNLFLDNKNSEFFLLRS